jgi:DNA-directed RNA polymerase specialized sigma24 family protein
MGYLYNAKPLPQQFALRHDKLLEQYYDRLQGWALHLTRGDVGKAHDIVHELCLYITLSAPDLSAVRNLDGYLYTSLRHIYLSDLARSSREALLSLDPSDLDSIQLVFQSQRSGDPQEQNDLRRICAYMAWRKTRTKSASYFILRFFHGYYRREVSTIAGVPLSTIDPKLNEVRSEVQLYLSEPDKLRFMNRDLPPTPSLCWTTLSSIEVFAELREMILASRDGDCLPEEVLLAHYSSPKPTAVSCPLLSHIVSCERCLSLIDRHFKRPTLKDREPLDCLCFDSESRSRSVQKEVILNREAMFQSVRRHCREVFEHSPRKLFIAVDGKIVASSEVRSGRSVLSARVELIERGGFVEVFSASGVRLALLSLTDAHIHGANRETQRVVLSDNRWLDLTLTLDGRWLDSEVVYFDPALATDFSEAMELSSQADTDYTSGLKHWLCKALQFFRLNRVTQFGWVISSLVLAVSVMVVYLLRPPRQVSAHELLHLATVSEANAFKAVTEPVIVQKIHVRLGSKSLTRTIYKDIARHRVVERGATHEPGQEQVEAAYSLSSLDWNSLLDAETYQRWRGDRAAFEDKVHPQGKDELVLDTTFSKGPVTEAFLTLRIPDYHVIAESLHFQDHSVMEIAEVSYDVVPFAFAPAGVFEERASLPILRLPAPAALKSIGPSNAELAKAEITAESVLHGLDADLGEQINISADGEMRAVVIRGVVSDDPRKEQLVSALHNIPHTQVSILTVDEALQQSSSSETGNLSDKTSSTMQVMASAPPLLESELNARLPDKDQRIEYVNQTLSLVQSASGRAWALNRLADRHSAQEVAALDADSRRQLNILLSDHISAIREDISSLQNRLAEVLPDASNTPAANTSVMESVRSKATDSSAEFSQDWKDRIHRIHSSTEAMHEAVTALLTSSQPGDQGNANAIEVNLRTSLTQLQTELQMLDQKVHKSDPK